MSEETGTHPFSSSTASQPATSVTSRKTRGLVPRSADVASTDVETPALSHATPDQDGSDPDIDLPALGCVLVRRPWVGLAFLTLRRGGFLVATRRAL